MSIQEELNQWVMSMDNPTRARYTALSLFQQGIRATDRTIIQLQYGYNDHDADILCSVLDEMEKIADHNLANYNPDLGF